MVAVVPEVKPTGRYSPTEAANLLGISRRMVYVAMENLDLPYTLSLNKQKRYISGTAIRKYFLNH